MIVTIHQPEHLPWLGFFHKMAHSDFFVYLDNVQYEKNYFQNRNKVRNPSAANGWSWATVPVLTRGLSNQTIDRVRVNNDNPRWGKKIVQTIRQSYGQAAFYEEYGPFIEDSYGARSWELLVDLNLNLIERMATALGLNVPTVRASELQVSDSGSALLLAICRSLGATTYLSGPSGRDYLDESIFRQAGIEVAYHEFHHPRYSQTREPFLPNMSLIDLLFNYGPSSSEILFGPAGIPGAAADETTQSMHDR